MIDLVTASGVWRPADRAESIYRYVPVEVPPGARALSVRLAYDRGAGVLDLGCFGPDGEFRGYSGGARDEFAIADDRATPGYLPGELTPGVWRVLLGLHRVPAEGLRWEIRSSAAGPSAAGPSAAGPGPLSTMATPPAPDRPPRRTGLPTVDGLLWLAGDLHAHTLHSDGALTIDALAAEAVAAGLDFLAVTDHNTVSHHPHLAATAARYDIALLPGQEITTDRGHANAFGDIGWIDFRRPAAEWVSTVADRGGLLSVNHPLGGDCAWRHPLPVRPPLAEVWHSGWWDRTWGAPLAWLMAWDPGTVPVGGSDFHTPEHHERLGQPTTWVAATSPSTTDILAGLAAGRTALSASPDGPLLLRVGAELIALGADGLLLADFTGRRRPVRGDRCAFDAEPGTHWLEDGRTQVMAVCA
jgi:hypothetical protein